MSIWSNGTRAVLQLLLDSTDHQFYFSEILEQTGLARSHLSSILDSLAAAGYVYRETEKRNPDSYKRLKRVYYSMTADGIQRVRLPAPQRVIMKLVSAS